MACLSLRTSFNPLPARLSSALTVANGLDPDVLYSFVRPDLGQNCLFDTLMVFLSKVFEKG